MRYSHQPHDSRSVVVSINTPWAMYDDMIYPSTHNNIKAVLPLWFDDVERGTNCMTETHAEAIKKFVAANAELLVIVHCDAGVSRSAGVAAALMKFYNGDDTPIFDNPQYRPNMLCYRVMLDCLTAEEEKA